MKWIPEWATHAAWEIGENSVKVYFFSALEQALFEAKCNAKCNCGDLKVGTVRDLKLALGIADVCQQIKDKPLHSRIDVIGQNGNGGEHYDQVSQPRNKYDIEVRKGVYCDVYDMVGAIMAKMDSPIFTRIHGAVEHAFKKLTLLGERGQKDVIQDLEEARDSLNRAIEMAKEWE